MTQTDYIDGWGEVEAFGPMTKQKARDLLLARITSSARVALGWYESLYEEDLHLPPIADDLEMPTDDEVLALFDFERQSQVAANNPDFYVKRHLVAIEVLRWYQKLREKQLAQPITDEACRKEMATALRSGGKGRHLELYAHALGWYTSISRNNHAEQRWSLVKSKFPGVAQTVEDQIEEEEKEKTSQSQ